MMYNLLTLNTAQTHETSRTYALEFLSIIKTFSSILTRIKSTRISYK